MNERIVFMGTPAFAANILEGLINADYNIVSVVSQADRKVGRKQLLSPSEVKKIALKYDIPVFTPLSIKDDYNDILALKPDLIITAAYGQFIPEALINYPKYKAINAHGSLLPKYRGGAPIQRAIMNGENESGISIIYMTKKMDAGEILYQKSLLIDKEDTSTTLFAKLSDLAKSMLIEFLPDFFAGNFVPKAQDESLVTFAKNISAEEELIDFKRDTLTVNDHIRSLLNEPGCYGVLNNKKYKFTKVSYEITEKEDAGVFTGLENDYLRINCLDGYIKVYSIKPEGKNEMKAKDFYNGARNLIGSRFNG